MHDRGVVAVAERPANLWVGPGQQFSDQVSRSMAGLDKTVTAARAGNVLCRHTEVLRRNADDLAHGEGADSAHAASPPLSSWLKSKVVRGTVGKTNIFASGPASDA